MGLEELESRVSVKLCVCWVDIPIAWAMRVLVAHHCSGCRSGSIGPARFAVDVEMSEKRFRQVVCGRVRSDFLSPERGIDPPGSTGAPGPPPATRSRDSLPAAPRALVDDEGRESVQFAINSYSGALKNWHREAATRGGLRLFSGTQSLPLTPRRCGAAPH